MTITKYNATKGTAARIIYLRGQSHGRKPSLRIHRYVSASVNKLLLA